jgi:hypothetical protein
MASPVAALFGTTMLRAFGISLAGKSGRRRSCSRRCHAVHGVDRLGDGGSVRACGHPIVHGSRVTISCPISADVGLLTRVSAKSA